MQESLFNDNAEYNAFVDKFKPKLTTDDCYTPTIVYEAVAQWVAAEYKVSPDNFVRPFYPGGDYENFPYTAESIVVDNPPFSILASIIRFCTRNHVRFFLFAPALTLFTAAECDACYLATGVSITYANGAKVNTSFVTNLDENRVRSAPDLFRAVDAANAENEKKDKASELPKYNYPSEVITAARVQAWSHRNVEFRVSKEESLYISALDAQKKKKKSIFGGGFLLKKAAAQAAAQAAATIEWELSEREKYFVNEKEDRGVRENLFDYMEQEAML